MADPEAQVPDAEGEPTSEEPTSEDPGSQGDGEPQPAELANQLMQNPQVLAALQDRLGSMVGVQSGYIQSLPKAVKRRLKALKKIQFEATKIEAEFYREVHKLECDYALRYGPLFEKRTTIVTGGYEPNDEEADWPSDKEDDDELSDEVKKKVNLEEKKDEEKDKEAEKEGAESKGVPGFWLTIFKNVDMLSEMIQPHDEAVLNHLQDVKVIFSEKDPMGFTLEFHFEANEHFANTVLTKQYTMRSEPDEGDPFSFEGPEIVKCKGCKIDWKKGKNVTVKTVKKKQKHKGSGTTRTITKTVQSDSFFNFFSPPTPPDEEEMDEDTEALLAADFEIGHFIRERIVPRAVLYFTGEALENDDEYEDGEEEDGAEEGEYDEDADPDYNPTLAVKYVTREFQEHCAKLALGRPSTPSLAPCDTRIPTRPSTGSTDRRTVAVETDPIYRPTTAPFRTNNYGTSELTKSQSASNDRGERRNVQTDSWVNKDKDLSAVSRESNSAKTVVLKGRADQRENEKSTDPAKSKINSPNIDNQQTDSKKETLQKHAKQVNPKIVNQGIGTSSLKREFTMVEMPLGEKTRQGGAEVDRLKTFITDKADQRVKQSEKNVAERKSRLDTLLEQTVELVEDALNCEGKAPSEISRATVNQKAKVVHRSRSEDTRQMAARSNSQRQKLSRQDDPRLRSVVDRRDENTQRRKVDQARQKLRQNTKRNNERQDIEASKRVKKPVRRMVWNQAPGQPYVRDMQVRARGKEKEKLRQGRAKEIRQSSAPAAVDQHSSSALMAQERSELQRPWGTSSLAHLQSLKAQGQLRRSHQSLTREANTEGRHKSSKSDRNQQLHHESRVGSSKSIKSQQSEDSDKSRPLVMLIEGDDPSSFQHRKLDMSRTSKSMNISNSIDFSGRASKLRGSPYLEYTPLVMGKPRKQRSASLNRSQQR